MPHTSNTQVIVREFCPASRKNCNTVTDKIFCCSSFKYLCKTAVDWVNSGVVAVTYLIAFIWNDPR